MAIANAPTGDLPEPDRTGIECAVCGESDLETTSIGESNAGALHAHMWCPSCSAGGCLSTNMPGRKSVCRRGRALRGDRHV